VFNFIKKKRENSNIFDILNIDTWNYASDSKEMTWNGSKLLDKDNKPLKEIDVVELARSIFKFLERNGNIVPVDKKIVAIKNLLNRMENPEYYGQLYEQEQLEKDKAIPDGLFNPRDPETYKYAKNKKPLVIDGVQIFNIHYKNDKEVKEHENEKGFANRLSAMMEIHKKAVKWEKSTELVKLDFIKNGIKEPNQETPGYVDRINEVYQSMLKNGSENKREGQEYIEKYIKQKVAECSPKKTANYGGYAFSEAQIEVLDGCSVETLKKIGKIMSTDKDSGKLKQEIFNSLGIDGEWVVSLRYSSNYPDIEEGIMYDYYLGFEDFSSEQDVYDFFNSRPYLEKRPELKQKVIEAVLEYVEEEDE
jgi:hypothetical protein